MAKNNDNSTETKESSFESKLKELEEIAALLERGEIPLEKSIELYERGITLHRECEKILAEARLKIENLSALDKLPPENKSREE